MNNSTSASPKHAEEQQSIGGQLVIPIAAVIFTLYYFSTIINSPWTAQVSAVLIGGILIFLCLLFIAKKCLLISRKQANLKMTELFSTQDIYSGRAAVFAITFAYIFLIEWGGFTITTFLFLYLSMSVLNQGRRNLFSATISLAMALGGYALFILAFNTRFPRGPFEALMKMVIENGL